MKSPFRTIAWTAPLAVCAAYSLTGLPAEPPLAPYAEDARRTEAFHKAFVLERQQNYVGAVDALRAAPRESSSSGYLTEIRLAWLYYSAGHYANSRREFALAARQGPGALEPLVGVQLPLLAQQRYSDVEQASRQALAIDPCHYYANLRQSYACRMQGKFGPAQKVNRKMLALYPSDQSFLLEQALSLAGEGAHDQARPYLLDVLRVCPSSYYARQALAATSIGAPAVNTASLEVYSKAAQMEFEGRYAEAIRLLTALSPDRSESYIHQARLGWLNYLAGDYPVSRRHYDKAALLAPKAVEPLLGMLLPMLSEGKFILAELTAREILELDPKNYTANLKLAYALRMQGRLSEAEKTAAGMLPLYPSDISLLLEHALALNGLDRPEPARELFQRVKLLAPDNITATQGLAQIQGRIKEALPPQAAVAQD